VLDIVRKVMEGELPSEWEMFLQFTGFEGKERDDFRDAMKCFTE
jgi:hypothetical protein